MTYQLPRGYDAWRTTPPEDLRPRGRFMPATVEDTICIDTPDVTIEALATYDAETGALVSVRINGRETAPHVIEALLGPDLGSEMDGIDPARLSELLNEAMQDAADECGDYLRDLRDE